MFPDSLYNRDAIAVPHGWVHQRKIKVTVIGSQRIARVVSILDGKARVAQNVHCSVCRVEIALYDENARRVKIRKHIHA